MGEINGDKPLVSIGLPVYNGETHLRQALDSLLAQDYENFELVISDNASTDSTREICLEYAVKDGRVWYHRNATNIGITRNFNRVFGLSSGELFMWASHDDLWEPNFVSRCAAPLIRSSAVLCYPRARLIGLDGETIKSSLPAFDTAGMDLISRFHAVVWGGANFPIYGLIRASALQRTYLFRDILGGDIILKTELALLGRFAHVAALLFHKRMSADREKSRSDWLDQVDAFVQKLDKPVTTKRSALRWYVEMVAGYVRVVNKHVPTYRDKAVLIPSVVIYTLIRWNWLLKLLLELSKRNRGKT